MTATQDEKNAKAPGKKELPMPAVIARREMEKRGWNAHALAAMCGYKSRTISNALAGDLAREKVWQKIEDVLGIPLITRPEEFHRRQK